MPIRRASTGEVADLPRMETWPLSGSSTPEITLASVLLPEPLPPMIACTSPANAFRLQPFKATVGPNVFLTDEISTVAWVMAGNRIYSCEVVKRHLAKCRPAFHQAAQS